MTTLTYHRQRHGNQIVGLLTFIGVPREMLYVRRDRGNASFWRRQIDFLAVLETARNLFRQRIKRLHNAGRFCELAIGLISAWNIVRARFAQNGWELER